MSNSSLKIGMWQGAGLMATTLLGTGVFILPQLTIATAGLGALIAWTLLTLAIIPITLVFAKLASVYPHAAGPAYFVERAFGAVAGRSLGLIFLMVVPLGAAAAMMMIFQFVQSLIQLTPMVQLITQLGTLALLFFLNLRGIQVSAKLQFILTIIIISVIFIMFGGLGMQPSLADTSTLKSPIDIPLIVIATSIAFWSFVGVEAMTHLSTDFKNPKRDLIPAMLIGTILVGIIFVASTLLLLLVPTDHKLAMVGVFDQLLGGYGALIIGILGISGGLATVNIYAASVARLAWSFANDGVLPSYLVKRNSADVPLRALATILGAMALLLIFTFITDQPLEKIITWANGVFVTVYFATMLAAIKLLDKKYFPLIILGIFFCLLVAWGLGNSIIYVAIFLGFIAPLLYWQQSNQLTQPLNNIDK